MYIYIYYNTHSDVDDLFISELRIWSRDTYQYLLFYLLRITMLYI